MIRPYLFESELQTLQTSACEGETVYFIAQVSPWIDTIIFDPGNGLGVFTVMVGDTINYIYPESGSFTSSLVATNGCGVIIDSSQITIAAGPDLELTMNTEACIDQEVYIELTSSSPIINPEIYFPDTTIYSFFTSYIPTISGANTIDALALDSVSLCPSIISNTLDVIEYTGTPIDVEVDQLCNQAFVTFNTPVDYLIIDRERIIEPNGSDNLDISFDEMGVHFIEFIKTDVQGCEIRQTVSVEIVENIMSVNAGRDTAIYLGDTIQLRGSIINGTPPYLITWSSSDPGNNEIFIANELDTEVQPKFSGFYKLTIEDANGCIDSDEVYVDVIVPDSPCNGTGSNHVFIPNAFSPFNQDGINDYFHIYAGPSVKEIKSFQVYNRWGGLVFQAKEFMPTVPPSSQHGWDGRLKEEKIQPGVFVWYIEILLIDGTEQICKGDVTLMY